MVFDEVEDIIDAVWVKPYDRGVASKPGELFLGIDAGIFADAVEGHVKRPDSVEILEDFFVADGVETTAVAPRQYSACLVKESVCHHLCGTAVDTLKQFFARTVKSDADKAVLCYPTLCMNGIYSLTTSALVKAVTGTEGRKGLSCLPDYLKCVDYAYRILQVTLCGVCRVGSRKLGNERREAIVCQLLLEGKSYVIADIWHGVNAVTESIDIHHRASRNDESLVSFARESVNKSQSFSFISRCAVVILKSEGADKMVGYNGHLCCSRSCGTNWQVAEHLPAVGVDDRTLKMLGQGDTHSGLANCSGADKDKDGGQGKR